MLIIAIDDSLKHGVKKMKKAMIIGFIAALALALPAWAADGYTDVPATHWAAESITACSAEGILGGYPDGAFRPDVTLNVGEYLKMLCCSAAPAYRFYNVAADPAFGGHWAHPYYTRLCELLGGVLPLQTDASALAAYLDRPITRLEMARLSAAAYARVVEGTAPASQKDPGFTDVASLSAEDREALAYCAEKNILGGFPDNTFRPSETLTRAQAAKVSALIYTSQWETRGVALRKMLGAEGGPLALALEKSYALSVERGEGLSDSACAELLQCLTEYCAKLPVQLPRNLGFCLSRLEEALPLSAPIPNQTSFSACIQLLQFKIQRPCLARDHRQPLPGSPQRLRARRARMTCTCTSCSPIPKWSPARTASSLWGIGSLSCCLSGCSRAMRRSRTSRPCPSAS